MVGFNPRAREGRDLHVAFDIRAVISFNPRAREGRDLNAGAKATDEAVVSIHAPARGATDSHINTGFGFLVSIHAPARGATT